VSEEPDVATVGDQRTAAPALRHRIATLLGADLAQLDDQRLVAEATARAQQRLERLVGEEPSPGRDAAAAETARLVADLQPVVAGLRAARRAERERRLERCERALGRLGAVASADVLLGRVCDEVVQGCGFGRALLSRVEHGLWHPWMVDRHAREEPWFADWRRRSIALDALTLETRLLADRRPTLVVDTAAVSVHPMILDGRCRSYVVAPIMPAGRVVGFLHADHRADGRLCDATDRDVLWRFAEGFGHLYERAALLGRVRAQRHEIRGLLADVEAALDELAEAELGLTVDPDGDRELPGPLASVSPLETLTPREREVLERIVIGLRNAEIAEQLEIGEATVKSHVKHILRKLGAVNRSQAIARYLGFRSP